METLIETGKFIAFIAGFMMLIYFCGTAVAAFFFWRSEKNAEREIKNYFEKIKQNAH